MPSIDLFNVRVDIESRVDDPGARRSSSVDMAAAGYDSISRTTITWTDDEGVEHVRELTPNPERVGGFQAVRENVIHDELSDWEAEDPAFRALMQRTNRRTSEALQ